MGVGGLSSMLVCRVGGMHAPKVSESHGIGSKALEGLGVHLQGLSPLWILGFRRRTKAFPSQLNNVFKVIAFV